MPQPAGAINFDEELVSSMDYQSDSEYAAELEHEWLKVILHQV